MLRPTMKTKKTLVTAAVLGGVALGAAVQGTAVAAPAAGGTVPSCVAFGAPWSPFTSWQKFTITNGCAQTVSVKVVFSNGPGSTCYSVPAHQARTETYYSLGSVTDAKSLTTC
ncbi:hypothetical protein [Streptomyces sp. NPDC049555]|uniref:hypothetical protein n=1 Tax=Streptomyces sp. NPDC049555 TaxID=3154930 RepID=UPI00343D9DD9